MQDFLLALPLLLLGAGTLTALAFSRSGWTASRLGWILSLFPLSSFLLILYAFTLVPSGKALTFSLPWIPALGLNFSLYLDGLSALFALLITGIGTLVVIYAGQYFGDEASAWRFHAYTLLFMLAMLGLVLAGDLITLFLFWEGTSISSFLLIAYKFKDEAARKGAFKSLFITGGGGIAMLAGFLFVMSLTGGADFKTILASGDLLRASPLYPVFFTLIAFGAFTKSAQFPAHIWLPEAMTAPTPPAPSCTRRPWSRRASTSWHGSTPPSETQTCGSGRSPSSG
jgi:NADH:ubiquinone oxidoreductase subunit 5 (subunit L)/multisubunit Na+/H+ antiporter MnhA subunit